MFTPSCQDKGLLYFPHPPELLRRFPAVFAFHPSVCLFKQQLMIDSSANRTFHIVLIHDFTSVHRITAP